MPSTSLRTVVAAVLSSALCTSASLAARGENAKLTVAENKVSIAGQPRAAGSTLAAGETIVTGARSRAEVTLPDGTVVRIGQASSFSFDGSKLVLSRGSALFHLTRKNSTITTPALVRTGQPGVVSVHASPSYNALFVLEGTDTVNGTPLVAGQAWVRDGSAPRTFAFDLKKMTSTSTLVTKFPVTPWIANTQALATLQQKLVAANAANPSQVQVVNRTANGATNTAGAKGITLANGTAFAAVSRSGATTGILGAVRSFFSGGSANANASLASLTKTGAGTLTLTQGSTSAAGVVINTGVSNSASTFLLNNAQTSGGTLTISAGTLDVGSFGTAARLAVGNGTFATTTTIGGIISAPVLNTSGGTLVVNGNTTNLLTGTSGGTFTSLSGGSINLVNSVSQGGTTLVAGNSGVIAGTNSLGATLTVTQPITGSLVLNAGNLNLTSLTNPSTITVSNSGSVINGITAGTLIVGQVVTFNNGGTYSVATPFSGGGLVLTRVGGVAAPVLGARPPSPVPLPPKPPGR